MGNKEGEEGIVIDTQLVGTTYWEVSNKEMAEFAGVIAFISTAFGSFITLQIQSLIRQIKATNERYK